jgi:TorA maturation chaperone TorD
MDTVKHQQTAALGDYFNLLAVLLEYKALNDVRSGILEGRVQADIQSIGCELDLNDTRINSALRLLEATRCSIKAGGCTHSRLRCEYTRLFNHPMQPTVAFYEGMFVNRTFVAAEKQAPDHELLFINQAACDADRQYKRAGVRRAECQNIPADCMATEMAFMGHLLQLETIALINGDESRLIELQQWRSEFARLHLRVWMAEFFIQLEALTIDEYFHATGLLGQVLAKLYYERYFQGNEDAA